MNPTFESQPAQRESIECSAQSVRDQLLHWRHRFGSNRPVYHAFEVDGKAYAYLIGNGSIFRLTVIGFRVLRLLSRDTPDGDFTAAIDGMLPEDAAQVAEFLEDLDVLHDTGALTCEESITDRDLALQVDNLINHQSRITQALVQTSCNLKCSYCYEVKSGFHSTGGKMSKDMGTSVVDLAFDRAADRPVVEIIFFGGEPLLNFDVIQEMVAHAERVGEERGKTVAFRMTTNGLLLTEQVCEFLVRKRFSVMVSIDGPAEMADLRRVDLGGKGTTERAVRGALLLLRLQQASNVPELSIRATLTRGNYDRGKVVEYLRSLGFRRVITGAASERAGVVSSDGPLPEEEENAKGAFLGATLDILHAPEYREKVSEAFRHGLDYTLQKLGERLNVRPQAFAINCGVGRNMLAVTADGSMYPCHRYAGEAAYKVGDMTSGIDRSRIESYYRELLEGFDSHCGPCWARVVCGGQCPWLLSNPNGRIESPTETSCNGIRTSMERLLAVYADLAEAKQVDEEASQRS